MTYAVRIKLFITKFLYFPFLIDKDSFESIPKWVRFINEYEKPLIIIVGNKVDAENQRKVKHSEGEEYAKKNNFLFFEVSAKENTNIKKLFFNSIVELPYFSQYLTKDNKESLVEEFEYENGDFNSTNFPGNTNDNSRINISMIDTPNSNKKCKC